MEGGGWDGRTAGRRRGPAILGQSLSEIRHPSVPDPATRAFGATPIPIDYTFLALVPSPRRDRPAAVGMPDGIKWDGRGLHGNAWDGMG